MVNPTSFTGILALGTLSDQLRPQRFFSLDKNLKERPFFQIFVEREEALGRG